MRTRLRSMPINDGDDDTVPAPVAATCYANETAGQSALTYTLSGTDAASFGIVRSPDGQLLPGQLLTKAKLDYETKNELHGHGNGHRP